MSSLPDHLPLVKEEGTNDDREVFDDKLDNAGAVIVDDNIVIGEDSTPSAIHTKSSHKSIKPPLYLITLTRDQRSIMW